ncbi:ABC protein [Favolaschia claudopus]|uniref:ABC protein n=1 Tax=Favolaschia claudopus TaxID=2862362 RepID=A0AAW0BFF2_9AGAR
MAIPEEPLALLPLPGSRHHALLNSNDPPAESDSAFIDSVFVDVDHRLTLLDHEMFELQQKLKQLEDLRASLLALRVRNCAIMSPLRRMPPELLREIFSWTLPSVGDELESEPGRFDLGLSPWLLTHVSSRWRAITLSTPSLWSRIVVNYQTRNGRSSPSYSLLLAKTHLQRARALQVHFYAGDGVDQQSQSEMFQLLAQHSERWEDLSLGLTFFLAPFLSSLQSRLPSLRRLWVLWTGDASPPSTEKTVDCFQTAPSLFDFGTSHLSLFRPIVFPAHQLTCYDTRGPWQHHCEILKQTPRLVQARIGNDLDEVWPELDGTIDLLHLRRLLLTSVTALRYLRAPSLQELALLEDIDPVPAFRSFLDRSSCCLKRLCVEDYQAQPLIGLLNCCSSIVELVIVVDQASVEASESMQAPTVSSLSKNAIIAPHLSLVFVGCTEDHDINFVAYLQMVQSRWETDPCSLKKIALAIEGGREPDSTTLERLHELRRMD